MTFRNIDALAIGLAFATVSLGLSVVLKELADKVKQQIEEKEYGR